MNYCYVSWSLLKETRNELNELWNNPDESRSGDNLFLSQISLDGQEKLKMLYFYLPAYLTRTLRENDLNMRDENL